MKTSLDRKKDGQIDKQTDRQEIKIDRWTRKKERKTDRQERKTENFEQNKRVFATFCLVKKQKLCCGNISFK